MYKTKEGELEQHVGYQDYILDIFDMKHFDAGQMRKKVDELYDKLKENDLITDELSLFLSKKASQFMSEDESLGFMLMYSFDTAFEFHSVVKKVLGLKNTELWDIIINP